MFLVSAVTSYSILLMKSKRKTRLKSFSDIVFLVGAVNQRWRSQNAVQTQYDHSGFMQQDTQIMSLHACKGIILNNIIFNKNTLHKAKATTDYPRASVEIAKRGTNKSARVSALADTGAQSNFWGWKSFQETGFCKKDLMHVTITIQAANKIPTNILGAFKTTFSGMPTKKEVIRCAGIVHFSDSVSVFFCRMKPWLIFLLSIRTFLPLDLNCLISIPKLL